MSAAKQPVERPSLLNLKLPCPIPTAIVQALVHSINGDGTMELGPEVLVQLVDALQVH